MRYGFEESAQGVMDAMFEYAHLAENSLATSLGELLAAVSEVLKRNNHMERLLAAGEELPEVPKRLKSY